MRPIKKCVVCLNYVKSKIKAVRRHSLEEQVLITFLFRKISWTYLTEEEFKGFLQQWGNPSDWAALCHICEKQVNEALSLHKQIMNLIRRISDIRRKLYTDNFYESDEEEEGEEDGENEAFLKLRRLLISDFKDQHWQHRESRRSMILNYHSNSTYDVINNGLKSKPAEEMVIKDELMSDNDSNHSGFLLEAPDDDFPMDQTDDETDKNAEAQTRPTPRNAKKRRYSDDNLSEMSDDGDPGEDTATDPLWGETSRKSSTNRAVSVNAVKVDKWPANLARGTKECPICEKRFVNGSSMRRHFRETHLELKETPSPCPHCNKTFLKKHYLLPHIKSAHPEKFAEALRAKPDIECPQCPSKFKFRKALKRHMLKTHGDGGEIYHCDQCNKKYHRLDSLINHKKFVHDEQSSQKEPSFDSKDAKNGLDGNESQDNIAKRTCDKCGKVFQSEHVMKRHISESHEKIKDHSCDQCSKTFARRSYLFRHIYNEHSDGDTDPMSCKVCGRICKGSSMLAKHMRQVHKQRQNASCDLCGRTYSQIAALNIHKKFAHPDNTKTETQHVDNEGNE